MESRRTPAANTSEITDLLARRAAGDGEALAHLVPLVYDDLRRIAHRRLRAERSNHTLDTTAVVHEAYIRLAEGPGEWHDRAHFFAVAARVIRHVLVDHARRRGARKREGSGIRVPLHNDIAMTTPRVVDFLALEEALASLERLDPRLVRVVECRFFGGLSMAETARATGAPLRTVERHWARAKAYLYQALAEPASCEVTAVS